MTKLFAIVQMSSGLPVIDPVATPYTGYALTDQLTGFGAYLISGSDAQLTAINALASVIGIVTVTEAGTVRWAELDSVIAPTVRTKLNTFLTARGLTNIPAGWTYRQVITAVFQRFNGQFNINGVDISE